MSAKTIALALQGGGSHGAFTWGVLDSLLADQRLTIEGFSGTSSGAMNATAAVQGLIAGGRAGARQSLDDFWRQIHTLSWPFAPLMTGSFGEWWGDHNLSSRPGWSFHDLAWNLRPELSPYEINPFNINPFRSFLDDFFDGEALRRDDRWKLFLAATHVESGSLRLFRNNEIGTDHLMASACLPSLFHAVEIDGTHYWDGGYSANPAIFPLIYECKAKDIVVVQLTKSRRAGLPRSTQQIQQRFTEITLNSCLIREIRAIRLITDLIDRGVISDPSMRRINLHLIKDEDFFDGLSYSSSFNTDIGFLRKLRAAGAAAGQRWIESAYDDLGTDLPFPDDLLEDYVGGHHVGPAITTAE